jgi:hypothetical protein
MAEQNLYSNHAEITKMDEHINAKPKYREFICAQCIGKAQIILERWDETNWLWDGLKLTPKWTALNYKKLDAEQARRQQKREKELVSCGMAQDKVQVEATLFVKRWRTDEEKIHSADWNARDHLRRDLTSLESIVILLPPDRRLRFGGVPKDQSSRNDGEYWLLVVYRAREVLEELNSYLNLPQLPYSEFNKKVNSVILAIKKVDESVPMTVQDIAGFPFGAFSTSFPFATFSELVASVMSGRCVVRRFAFRYDMDVFNILACKSYRLFFTTVMITTWVAPIVAIVLAFYYSGWWLMGLSCFFFGMKACKSMYYRTIIRSALTSEPAFCLLFYCSQIHVYDIKKSKEYEWQLLKKKR